MDVDGLVLKSGDVAATASRFGPSITLLAEFADVEGSSEDANSLAGIEWVPE